MLVILRMRERVGLQPSTKRLPMKYSPEGVIMKEDTPGKHPHGLLPILDTKVCVKDGKIIFHHFAKPKASLEVVLFRSSMSMGAKLSILTQEACRRIRNFSPALPWSLKVKEINKLMWQMREGGYSEKTREIKFDHANKYDLISWRNNC